MSSILPSFTLKRQKGIWTVRVRNEQPKQFNSKAKALEYINNKVFEAIGI